MPVRTQDQSIFQVFPSVRQSTINISADFQVSDKQGLLKFAKINEGDRVSIEHKVGSECEPVWVPFRDCCGLVRLAENEDGSKASFMVLPIPGTYRAVITNTDVPLSGMREHLEEIQITFELVRSNHDLSQFYHTCC